MEDFYYAGGLPAVLREIAPHLHLDALTVNGQTLGENIADAPLLEPRRDPPAGGAVQGRRRHRRAARQPGAGRRGDQAIGCLAAAAAASGPRRGVRKHRGLQARIDDEALDIDETCVMVLKNCGPRGYPGMAEVGNMPLPPKLLRRGITDIVRISDARMSGTAYGTVVLHVSPEAAAGGPLALVRDGDFIELDVPARRLHLDVPDEELARRRAGWQPPAAPARGWAKLYVDHVQQAHLGADLDFLVGGSGDDVTRDSH